jgi:hypothetical protein
MLFHRKHKTLPINFHDDVTIGFGAQGIIIDDHIIHEGGSIILALGTYQVRVTVEPLDR